MNILIYHKINVLHSFKNCKLKTTFVLFKIINLNVEQLYQENINMFIKFNFQSHYKMYVQNTYVWQYQTYFVNLNIYRTKPK